MLWCNCSNCCLVWLCDWYNCLIKIWLPAYMLSFCTIYSKSEESPIYKRIFDAETHLWRQKTLCTFCCCANPLTVKIWSTCNHLSPICLVFFLIYLFWNHSRHIYGDFHSKALKYIVYNATDGYQSHFLNPPNRCCMFVVSVRLNRGTTAVLPPTVNRPAWITSFLGLSRRWLKSACGLCVRVCICRALLQQRPVEKSRKS